MSSQNAEQRRSARRGRYASVTATLALVIALGGTSYAAITLPKNSVGSKQIKSNAVTGAKIKAGAVTSSDIKNGALQGADFKSGQLPAGAKGDTGTAGAKGDTGETGAKGTAKASALVMANTFENADAPVFTGPHPGFTAVRVADNDGVYCLTPEVGVVVHDVGIVATVDTAHTSSSSASVVFLSTSPPSFGPFSGCDPEDLVMGTYDATGGVSGTLTANISFTVAVV